MVKTNLHIKMPKIKNKMNVLFAIVVLVQILIISASFVLAWTETISSLKLIITDGTVGSPIKTTANITSGDTALNLDNYFRESANVHLAPASSPDGVNFYFPSLASTSNPNVIYRPGTVDDKNVNYISFSLNIHASDSAKEFYFRKTPTVKVGNNIVNNNEIRIAITSNNETHIYTNDTGDDGTTIISRDGATSSNTTPTKLRAYEDYISGEEELFKIANGATEEITISLWLEDPELVSDYAGKQVTVENFELITTEQQTTEIKFIDKTSYYVGDENINGWHWVGNDNAVMWLYDVTNQKEYQMHLDTSDTTNKTWVADIPYLYQNESNKVEFYRCSPAGFGTDKSEDNESEGYWNKWEANYSATSNEYTAYGGSNISSVGYGIWGKVELIALDSLDTEILSKENQSAYKPIAKVSDTDIISEMNFKDNCWQCYVPEDNLNFKFDVVYVPSGNESTTTVTAEIRPNLNVNNYTITSQNTGYWGTPVNVQTAFADGCTDTMGTAGVEYKSLSANSIFVSKDTEVTLKATAKTGYAFDGWYTDTTASTLHSDKATVDVTASDNITYYAKFVNAFDITAKVATKDSADNTNGGTVKLKNETESSTTLKTSVKDGGSVTFVATENTGYTFIGWYSLPNGGEEITNDKEVTLSSINQARTIYARFSVNKLSVIAHAVTDGTSDNSTGGTVAVKGGTASNKITAEYYYDSNVTLVASNIDGYDFKGWYSKASNGDKITSEKELVLDNTNTHTNVYALFTKKAKTIYFTNSQKWSGTIYCYAWEENNGNYVGNNGAWPGRVMTLNGTNDYKENVYIIEIPDNYTHIIFNNGEGKQTVNITLGTENTQRYYAKSTLTNNNYDVGTW